MYDKFDDDAEKAGLRLDGNEVTFDRRRIRKIINRVFLIVVAILFMWIFIVRQEYNINRRDLTNIHPTGFEGGITARRGSVQINDRTLVNDGRRIVVSQIHYVYGIGAGYSGGQVRFHVLVPNPFFGGDLDNVEFDVRLDGRRMNTIRLGDQSIPITHTFAKSFWRCQMLNVTLSFREDTVLPVSGETITVTMRGEGINSVLTFEMP